MTQEIGIELHYIHVHCTLQPSVPVYAIEPLARVVYISEWKGTLPRKPVI